MALKAASVRFVHRALRWIQSLVLASTVAALANGCGPATVTEHCLRECEEVNALYCTPSDYLECNQETCGCNGLGCDDPTPERLERVTCIYNQYGCFMNDVRRVDADCGEPN